MATWYSQSSGLASVLSRWNSAADGSGSTPAAITDLDDDTVEIQDNHVVDWDVDSSGWTNGMIGMLIRGDTDNDGNTGMLRMDSTTLAAGTYCLKFKAGSGLSGTTVNGRRGKVLVNSDGVWANTGAIANDRLIQFIFLNAGSGTCVSADNLESRIFCEEPTAGCPGVEYTQDSIDTTNNTITVTPWETGVDCHFFDGSQVRVKAVTTVPGGLAANTTYYVVNKTANTFQLSTSRGGSAIDLTDSGTGQVDYYQYFPGVVRTYKSLKTVSSINTSTNVITMNASHGWSSGTAVAVRSSGTMPGGLRANVIYYTYAVSGADLKLVGSPNGQIVDITSAGTGTIEIYDGHTDTATAVMNVLDDVTGDSVWSTTTERNRAALVNLLQAGNDTQRVTLSTITASAITLSANVDSAQAPGAMIVLCNRNVSMRSSYTTGLYFINQSVNAYSGNVYNCEIYNAGTPGQGYGPSATLVSNSTAHTYGGCIHDLDYGLTGLNSGGTVNATIVRCNRGISGGNNLTINGNIFGSSTGGVFPSSNCLVRGNIYGCGIGVYMAQGKSTGLSFGCTSAVGASSSGIFSGLAVFCATGITQPLLCVAERALILNCGYGSRYGTLILRSVVYRTCAVDLRDFEYFEGYGLTLGGLTQIGGYTRGQWAEYARCVVFDLANDGTPQAGHIKAASAGGMLTTVTGGSIPSSPPVTLDYCYKQTGETTLIVNQSYNWIDIFLWGKAGTALTLDVYEKCDSNPSTFTDGPVWEFIDPKYEWGHASSVLDSVSAQTDGGNDTNWHTLTLSHTPTVDGPIIFRARMKDTAKIVYWMFAMTGGYGGSGGIFMPRPVQMGL